MALQELSRRRANPKNRIGADVERVVMELALEQPARGQVRVANELAKRAQTIASGRTLCLAPTRAGEHEAATEGSGD